MVLPGGSDQAARPGLYARRHELEQLHRTYRQVLQTRRPRLVAVTGENGVGKTALVEEFLDQLAPDAEGRAAPQVARSRADGQGEPYLPVTAALRDLVVATRKANGERGRRMLRSIIDTAADASALLPPETAPLPQLIGGARLMLRLLPDKGGTPELREQATAAQISAMLRWLTLEQPLVLFIDDAEHADNDTAWLLRQLARELQGDAAPVLVLVAYEPAARDLAEPLLEIERAVRDLTAERLASVVEPDRLRDTDVPLVVADRLGQPPGLAAARRLHEHAEGMPSELVDAIAVLEEAGLDDPRAWTPEVVDRTLATPAEGTRRHLGTARRLDGLSIEERELVATAAVLGRVVPLDALRALHPSSKVALATLLRRRALLDPDPGAAGCYRFTHARTHEYLLQRLHGDPTRWREQHLRCAEWLERQEADPDRLAALAMHYRDARELERAVAVAERAAVLSRDHGTWRGRAVHLAIQVERWTGEAPAEVRARAALAAGDALMVAQRLPEALDAAGRALTAAGSGGQDAAAAGYQAAARVLRAMLELEGDDASRKLEDVDGAVATYPRLGPDWTRWLLIALHAKAWLAMRKQRWTVCEDALDQAERVLGPLPEPVVPEHLAASGRWLETAGTSRSEPWGHPIRWGARLAQVRGEALAEQGRWAEAREPLQRAFGWSWVSGARLGCCAAVGWLGLARCHTGDMGGLDLVREALHVERDELLSEEGVAKWLTRLGRLHLQRGELELAAGMLWLGEALWEDLGHSAVEQARAALGSVHAAIDTAEGDGASGRLRERFNPWATEYAEFAFLWRLPPFGKYPGNPVLRHRGTGWESLAVFNPTILVTGDGEILMLYRALGPHEPGGPPVSSIGLALGADPVTLRRDPSPVMVMTEPHAPDREHGLEDPRLARVDGTLVLTLNEFDGHVPRIVLARGQDPRYLERVGYAFHDEQWFPVPERPHLPRGWVKSAALIPRQIEGRWWLLFGDSHIWAAHSPDMETWTIVQRPVFSPLPGTFFSYLVEPGPAPVVRPEGILMVFNGAERLGDGRLRYAIGEALLSATDPTQLLRLSLRPILEVDHPEERNGLVEHEVVFASGFDRWHGHWKGTEGTWFLLYFGMGDRCIGLATADATHGPPV